MKKKGIILLVILVIAVVAFLVFGLPYIQRHFNEVKISADNAAVTASAEDVVDKTGKTDTITVYFTRVGNSNFEKDVDAVSSASLMTTGKELVGNSAFIAGTIREKIGGDIYAIKTEKQYPSSYSDTVSVASDELKNKEVVKLKGQLPDMSKYKKVYLVLPIWWGTIPNAVGEFIKNSNMDDAVIYTVISHGGSEEGRCLEDIKKLTKGKFSDKFLTVHDRDTTECKELVEDWLKEAR
ncbi:MAG: hypothetical protein IJ132_00470 [Firmicutes bacterium]|nr:hypothetical protein [Bacillota bacterium]